MSLFSLLNRLVDLSNGKYAVLQSDEGEIIKTFQGSRPLREGQVDPRSIAYTFKNPSDEEEIRTGDVLEECWVCESKTKKLIYEQSINNPNYNKVLTLLTFK